MREQDSFKQPLDYINRVSRPDQESLWQTIVGAFALILSVALIFLISLGLSA